MRQPQRLLLPLHPPKVRHPQDLIIQQKPPLMHEIARKLPAAWLPRLLAPDLPIARLQIPTELFFVDHLQHFEDSVAQDGEGDHVYVAVVRDCLLQFRGQQGGGAGRAGAVSARALAAG